ncbi:MAG: AGE family epimerase/isomerase [Oscillospiraceae bacterium]|nr:AGE family epimerase/isomerase [Oscillospiraceae bacterium]
MLKEECKKELTGRILPFWNKLRDDEYGGFYGQMDNDLVLDKKGGKGVILNSRILWFYSSVYLTLKESDPDTAKSALDNARHAFLFLRDKCVDRANGGVYWMMRYDGEPLDTMKHTYNQAFAIYALSTYYLAARDEQALDLAYELFDTVEKKCTDDIAYMEAFDISWQLIENDALSENGLMADKTMNTVLHLIEGYTVLYKAGRDERVAERLRFLLDITEKKIFDSENDKLLVFFDRELNVIGDIHSYGHDIEASWLIDRACEVLGDKALTDKWAAYDLRIAENIYKIAYDGETGSLLNERDKTEINRKRIWWVQAETVVGFVNAYQHGGDRKFLEAADRVMQWIENVQCDKRENSEWWAEVAPDGTPLLDFTMVNEWKCPYHNGRMCMEILTRL